jgi:hypothetical protein
MQGDVERPDKRSVCSVDLFLRLVLICTFDDPIECLIDVDDVFARDGIIRHITVDQALQLAARDENDTHAQTAQYRGAGAASE